MEVSFKNQAKPPFDAARKSVLDPLALRAVIGDGNYGGAYQKPDEEMMALWAVAVDEAREAMEEGWS